MLVHSGFQNYRIIDKNWREIDLKDDCFDCCSKKSDICQQNQSLRLADPFWVLLFVRSAICDTRIDFQSTVQWAQRFHPFQWQPDELEHCVNNIFLTELVLSGMNDKNNCQAPQKMVHQKEYTQECLLFSCDIHPRESNTTSVEWTVSKCKNNFVFVAIDLKYISGSG